MADRSEAEREVEEPEAWQTAPRVKPRYAARKLLHYTVYLPVHIKALLMLAMILTLSFACSSGLVGDSWLADPANPLNSLLVKWSWGWTLLCLCPAVVLTAFLYSGLAWWPALRHLVRLPVAHCVWLCGTRAFVLLDRLVGRCQEETLDNRSTCLREGSQWMDGFDISGHIFLLCYCVFVLTEEVTGLRTEVWGEYPAALKAENRFLNKQHDLWLQALLMRMHEVVWPAARALELLAAAEMALWTFMAAVTSLYFHVFWEKMMGFMLSWAAWFVSYRLLYGRPYLPARPDQGRLHPLHHMPVALRNYLTTRLMY